MWEKQLRRIYREEVEKMNIKGKNWFEEENEKRDRKIKRIFFVICQFDRLLFDMAIW